MAECHIDDKMADTIDMLYRDVPVTSSSGAVSGKWLYLSGHAKFSGRYVMYGRILCPIHILCLILYIKYPTHIQG